MRDRVDVKDLKTYQQVYIYIIPIITNLGFINMMVVVVRLYWFQTRLKSLSMYHWRMGCPVYYLRLCLVYID